MLSKLLNEKKEIITYFKNLNCLVSLTTDGWTDTSNRQFMALTAHFISNNYNIEEIVLSIAVVPAPHDRACIAKYLKETIDSYKLHNKILAVTTDNAANVVAGVESFTYSTVHNRCFCHVINLVVQCGVEKMDPIISVVKKIVRKIRASPLLETKLIALCAPSNVTYKKLILDVATRWNSTLQMIERFIYLKEPLQQLCLTEEFLETMDIQSYDVLQQLIVLLKPFEICTSRFSSSLNATIGEMLLGYKHLQNHLQSYNCNIEIVNTAVSIMRMKLILYYNKQNEATRVTTILDPRIKLMAFNVLEHEEVLRVFKEYFSSYCSAGSDPTNDSEQNFNSSLIGTLHRSNASLLTEASELDRYIRMDTATENTNVLEWWRGVRTILPNLADMARDYLAIMPSSASSERLFSVAGQIITKSRNRLSDDTAESAILLHSWNKVLNTSR